MTRAMENDSRYAGRRASLRTRSGYADRGTTVHPEFSDG
jgi:hypothetical protein